MSPPNRVGQYELQSRIGQGGMAEVFIATHVGAAGFERPVCVKRILSVYASDQEFRALFMKEAKVAGRLCHANIVQVFDCIEDGEELAIVMELVDGLDLRSLLYQYRKKKIRADEGIVAFIAGQMLMALRFAHAQYVVHRDVSPHNILLSRQGEVKLADFGVAKAMLTHAHASCSGDLKGKLAYMSPEQARGQSVDYRTDLYSLGLVLFELLMGRKFFESTNHGELFGAVANAQRPTIEKVDDKLGSLIEGLLEPEPENRIPTAQDALLQLPQWGIIGPSGAIAVSNMLKSLEFPEPAPLDNSSWAEATRQERDFQNYKSQRSEITPLSSNRSETPFGSSTGDAPIEHRETNLGGTEIRAQQNFRKPERPVIPGDRNAPTATREDDVEKALALAPTAEYIAECDQSGAPGDGESSDEIQATGIRKLVITPMRIFLCALIGAVIVAFIIGFGGRAMSKLLNAEIENEPGVEPSASEITSPSARPADTFSAPRASDTPSPSSIPTSVVTTKADIRPERSTKEESKSVEAPRRRDARRAQPKQTEIQDVSVSSPRTSDSSTPPARKQRPAAETAPRSPSSSHQHEKVRSPFDMNPFD